MVDRLLFALTLFSALGCGLKRASERRVGGRRPRELRRRQLVDKLSRQLDGLEPCADGRIPFGGGIADRCASVGQTDGL